MVSEGDDCSELRAKRIVDKIVYIGSPPFYQKDIEDSAHAAQRLSRHWFIL